MKSFSPHLTEMQNQRGESRLTICPILVPLPELIRCVIALDDNSARISTRKHQNNEANIGVQSASAMDCTNRN
jgi:hypothetical protein